MYLRQIELFNFKNYTEATFHFGEGINCLLGDNGAGKTNLLDAIHYLALTKSYFNTPDTQSIRHHESLAVLRGTVILPQQSAKVMCGMQQGQKKMVQFNGVPYERVSEHIGKIPLVMIAPQDAALITEGSEERRRFVDTLLCQLDAQYLTALLHYQHYLRQRNTILKQWVQQHQPPDHTLLEVYDSHLLHHTVPIFQRRKELLAKFVPMCQRYYAALSGRQETIDIRYESDCDTPDFVQLYRKAFAKDWQLQRTTLGLHRDDFVWLIDGYPLKKVGSQGQQKSFLIALKLTQFEILHQHKASKPLLLLDDIFDKLDDKRITHLLHLMAQDSFGQIFLTDARPERTAQILADMPHCIHHIQRQT